MNEILNELTAPQKRDKKLSLFFAMSLILCGVAVFGIYVGTLLFGDNSLEVFLKLDSKQRVLEEKVEELKHSNAELQKEYFELKELEPKE